MSSTYLNEFTQENKDKIKVFFDEFQAAFPDINPLYIMPLLFTIDINTWKFSNVFHEGAIAPQIEFIEQNETLRQVFQDLNNRNQ